MMSQAPIEGQIEIPRCVSFITNASGTLVNILFEIPRISNKVDASVQTEGDYVSSDSEDSETDLPPETESQQNENNRTGQPGEGNEEVRIVCNVCEEILDSAQELKKHMKENHENYKCNFCRKKFARCSELRAHIKLIHKKNELLHCECCNEIFLTPRSLEKHLLIHVKCDVCENHYLDRESLQNHTCEPDKDLKCRICKKLFRSQELLETHLKKSHSQKVICKICKKYYKGDKNLALHMKNTHNTRLNTYKSADKTK